MSVTNAGGVLQYTEGGRYRQWPVIAPKPKTRSSGFRKQRFESAGTIQLGQIVEATDVDIPDKDLRHRPPFGSLGHFQTSHGIEIHPYFVDVPYSPTRKQTFRHHTKRTKGGTVHRYLGHKNSLRWARLR
jgi:hypothetical protein